MTQQRLAPVVALVCLLAGLGPARPAPAQGTSGTLPDPISSAELDGYADRLGLSAQQRLAIAPFHAQYKLEYEALREGEIAEFMSSMRGLQGQGMMPKRDQLDETMKSQKRLMARIAALDDRLFARMPPLLTDEQAARLARARMARERVRYSKNQMTMASGIPTVDLSELAADLDFTPEQRPSVDAILASYESKLTRDVRKLHEATTRLWLDVFDALEAAGLTDVDMTDPDATTKMMEVMQAVMAEITEGMRARSRDIADLNRKTYRSISAILSPEAADTLRRRFYGKTYPEIAGTFSAIGTNLRRALETEGLSDEQREGMMAVVGKYERDRERMVDNAVKIIDDFRDAGGAMSFDMERFRAYSEALATSQRELAELQQTTMKQLYELAGELTPKVTARIASTHQRALEAAAGSESAGSGKDPADDLGFVRGPDEFVPPDMRDADVQLYGRLLDLDEAQVTVLQQLRRDAIAEHGEAKKSAMSDLREAQSTVWGGEESAAESEEAARRLTRARIRALEAVVAADDAFFENAAAVIDAGPDEPRLRRARQTRTLQVHNHGPGSGFGNATSNEGGVDLAMLVLRLPLSPDERTSLDGVLDAYRAEAIPLFRTRLDAARHVQEVQASWNRMWSAPAEDSGEEVDMMQRMQEMQKLMGTAYAPLEDAEASLSDLNRKTLPDLLAALPEGSVRDFRSLHGGLAYPNVYGDAYAATTALSRAVELDDLTADQRTALADLAAMYRTGYDEITAKMTELCTVRSPYTFFVNQDPAAIAAYQEREDRMSRHRFDRDELNADAWRRLQAILGETQLRRIGGVPKRPTAASSNPWE